MLVTRQNAPEQSHWSISSKFETTFHKSADSSRMSNNYDAPLSTQSDWQGQYSFLPPEIVASSRTRTNMLTGAAEGADSQTQPRSATAPSNPLDIEALKSEPGSITSPASHHRNIDPLGLRQPKPPSPIPEQAENQGEQYAQKAAESAHEESLVSTETPGLSLGSNPMSSVSSASQAPEVTSRQPGNEVHVPPKDEEDDIVDDEEMIEGEGDGDSQPQAQTAAERTAQRRKMKRFR